VKFLVLGDGETCTGDSARRSGNEFLFQQLATQNVETINGVFEGVERVDRKIISTCPHCFNTLGREYPQVGGTYTVLHHTQLLNRLVRDKKLIPVDSSNGGGGTITYHDPCYLGRHNKVYDAPRELIGASGATLTEMPRHAETGFCCGAGGARMWMEEHLGKRVNHERVDEALNLDPTTIATGCPFCRVMLSDGVGDRGKAEQVEVVDVAQLLLASLDRSTLSLPEKGTAAKLAAAAAPAAPPKPAPQAAPVAAAPAATSAAAAPAAPAAPAKGLGMAAGAKRPGAKKAATPSAEATASATPSSTEASAPAPAVKGLGMAAGAKRPGAKKAAAPSESAAEIKPDAPAAAAPVAEATAEPESGNGTPDAPPVKGLGMAKGARPPGKRK
jgi:hypothetical protein